MEAQRKNIGQQDKTADDVANVVKQRIKFISVTYDGKVINFPIRYSINVSEAYHDSFKETNDYRAAFCTMAYQMVEDNKKFVDNKEEIADLTAKDIKALSDEDLKKIGETLIQEVDTLKKHYHEDTEPDFFKRFHGAICAEKKEFEEKLKEGIQPVVGTMQIINNSIKMTSSMQSLLNTISALRQTTATLSNLQPNFEVTQYPDNWLEDNYLESPIVTTNELLKKVSIQLQELNERESFHFEKNIEINKQIADVLFEQYQAQKKAEKVNKIT
jgi:hypothetical protein